MSAQITKPHLHIIIQIFPAQIRCAVKEYFSWLPLKVFDVHSKNEYEKELLADEVTFALSFSASSLYFPDENENLLHVHYVLWDKIFVL